MTGQQLYISIGAPMLFNAVLIGLMIAYINATIEGLESRVNQRFEAVNQRFDAIDRRFDDMRDLRRAELYRLEGVLDARLKHLEESR